MHDVYDFVSLCMHTRPQGATERDIDLKERARKHGWSTRGKFFRRVKYRMNTILQRTANCFSALTEQEMASYLKSHKEVCHLSPSMEGRQDTVKRLMELKLPAPELSSNPSESFCTALYQMLTRWIIHTLAQGIHNLATVCMQESYQNYF